MLSMSQLHGFNVAQEIATIPTIVFQGVADFSVVADRTPIVSGSQQSFTVTFQVNPQLISYSFGANIPAYFNLTGVFSVDGYSADISGSMYVLCNNQNATSGYIIVGFGINPPTGGDKMLIVGYQSTAYNLLTNKNITADEFNVGLPNYEDAWGSGQVTTADGSILISNITSASFSATFD